MVVDDDPFWSVVRRRHPDVDIVLLPPDGRAQGQGDGAGTTSTASLDLVRAAADGVVAAWSLLRPLVAEAGATEQPSVRWGSGGGDEVALVIEKAVAGIGQESGTALLREITATLARAGWRLRPGMRGDLPLLEATDGHTDVVAVAGPGATVLTIASGVLPVADPDRETAADEVRAVVGSW